MPKAPDDDSDHSGAAVVNLQAEETSNRALPGADLEARQQNQNKIEDENKTHLKSKQNQNKNNNTNKQQKTKA